MYCTEAPANRFIFPIRMVASNEFLSSPIASPSSAWNPICSVVVHCHLLRWMVAGVMWSRIILCSTTPSLSKGRRTCIQTFVSCLTHADLPMAHSQSSVLSPLIILSPPFPPSSSLLPSPSSSPPLLPLPHHLYVLVLVTRWIFSLDVAFLIS